MVNGDGTMQAAPSLLKTIDPVTLREVVESHARYRAGTRGGLRANLAHADLSNCALEGVDLAEADLSGARLQGAFLAKASLDRAVLFGADLRNADLREASLVKADLRGVCLRGANLAQADLSDCDLREGVIALQDTHQFPHPQAPAHAGGAVLRHPHRGQAGQRHDERRPGRFHRFSGRGT